jgi:hypothetical protein
MSGSRSDGAATELWLTLLRRRLSPGEYDSVAAIRRPRSPGQQAWARLIESRARRWPEAAHTLPSRRRFSMPGRRGSATTFPSPSAGMQPAAAHRHLPSEPSPSSSPAWSPGWASWLARIPWQPNRCSRPSRPRLGAGPAAPPAGAGRLAARRTCPGHPVWRRLPVAAISNYRVALIASVIGLCGVRPEARTPKGP